MNARRGVSKVQFFRNEIPRPQPGRFQLRSAPGVVSKDHKVEVFSENRARREE